MSTAGAFRESTAARRQIISDTIEDADAVFAAACNRRCRADALFRKAWGRYIRQEIGEEEFRLALEASLERERTDAAKVEALTRR